MKKFKYSGKTPCQPGEMMILQDDGSVITHREAFPPCKVCGVDGDFVVVSDPSDWSCPVCEASHKH